MRWWWAWLMLVTTPLADALDRAWDRIPAPDGGTGRGTLLPGLAADAVLARYRADGATPEALATVAPRLLELLVEPATDDATRIEIADALGPVSDPATQEVLDAWWAQTLALEPSPPGVEMVLGCLVRCSVPLVRRLEPWVRDLDGPPARHLAELVLGGLAHPVWDGHDDQRRQVAAWTQTEPVVMGLTIVGGIHLDDGVLGRVLEVLLP